MSSSLVAGGDLPQHVAVIMDGNGRWARSRGMPMVRAYEMGIVAAEQTVEACIDHSIKNLTLYVFSLENWMRDKEEVENVMNLLRNYLFVSGNVEKLMSNNVNVRFVGDLDLLGVEMAERMKEVQYVTCSNGALFLSLAVSYGARQDIINAVNAMLRTGVRCVDEEILRSFLWSRDLPDVDLLIRPGGEKRVSNFLLWQLAYAELYFCDTMWPDFTKEHFARAIYDYAMRNRRYGR